MLRAITHIHTNHSWDGSVPPAVLTEALLEANIDLALISDHDSFAGARQCRHLVAERGSSMRIPLAAEIRTERGDVIIVLDELAETHEPPMSELKQWDKLVPLARDLGALVWLPHPYQSHEFTEELAAEADVIEVFNARCSDEQNRNGALLCERHGAVPAYGADVHRLPDLGRCVVEYEEQATPLESLRRAPTPLSTTRNERSSTMAAQFTSSRRGRQPTGMAFWGLRWLQATMEERRARALDG